MIKVDVFEPPQGCGVGNCGPDAEDELATFDSLLEWLQERGVAVSRYNLGLEPEVFARNEGVKAALQQHGLASLPFVLVNGKPMSQGRYPTKDELAGQLGNSF